MFISQTRLPHVLAPNAYFSTQQFQREQIAVLKPAWHAIGTINELKRNGDFITRELFGYPIQVRNFDGELRVLSNICAHRHCLLTSKRCGNSAKMSCQYHGWEYGPDGKTRKIPQPKNFAPYPQESERIPLYRVDTCGQIVFVCLSANAADLPEFLGDYREIIEEKFGSRTKEFLRFDVDYAANWKVPVENSLESYHVPNIHQQTFREDPGEERSTHVLSDRATAFGTALPFSPHSRIDAFFQRGEIAIVKMLGGTPAGEYWQHHLYPNLLLSFTDAISLLHCVIPTGPTTATAIVRQFGNLGNSKWGPRRWTAVCWGKLKGAITKKIMTEDLGIIPDIQAGLEKSEQRGILGRCEERIHAFQTFISERTVNQASADLAADPQIAGQIRGAHPTNNPVTPAVRTSL